MTRSAGTNDDPILAALALSARALDADAAARPDPATRARGRAELTSAIAETHDRRGTPRKVAAVAAAVALSGLIAVPALADQGGMGTTVSNVTRRVSAAITTSAEPDTFTPEQLTITLEATPSATPGSDLAMPAHPENHGADVSAVARATPEAGQSHGEQVREVARDNHGHQTGEDDEGASPTATPGTEEPSATEEPTEETTTPETGNHGAGVSAAAHDKPDTSHGADVSAAAHEPAAEDQSHGEQVREVARDNHGQSVSAAARGNGTPTPTPTPTATATATPERDSGTGGSGDEQTTGKQDSSQAGKQNKNTDGRGR